MERDVTDQPKTALAQFLELSRRIEAIGEEARAARAMPAMQVRIAESTVIHASSWNVPEPQRRAEEAARAVKAAVVGRYRAEGERERDAKLCALAAELASLRMVLPNLAARASIEHLKTSSVERSMQQRQARLTKAILADAGLPVMHTDTHIVPLLVGDARQCKAASDMLLEKHNIYIQPINYPTVPKGTERLRITPTPLHTDEMIFELRHALVSVWTSLELPRERADAAITASKLTSGDLTLPTIGG